MFYNYKLSAHTEILLYERRLQRAAHELCVGSLYLLIVTILSFTNIVLVLLYQQRDEFPTSTVKWVSHLLYYITLQIYVRMLPLEFIILI